MSENKPNNFGSFVTGYTLAERQAMPDLSFMAYCDLVKPLAKEIQESTGILHHIPMIQSAHESRNGNSGLSKEYGNLFGFKATKSWKANGKPVANLPTWEVVRTDNPEQYKDYSPTLIEKYNDGGKEIYKLKIVLKQEFRIYHTWRDSFFDWGRLISTVPAYKAAYPLLAKKETVRDGLKSMAIIYATDHNYAKSMLSLYERVSLDKRFD